MDPTSLIPHRPPWLVLDRVEVAGDQGRGLKLLTAGDPLCADGALPEVLVIEALAETAAAVMGAAVAAGGGAAAAHRGYLIDIRGFEFAARAVVGGSLVLHAVRTTSMGRLHRFVTHATVDGTLVATGQLGFAVEAAP